MIVELQEISKVIMGQSPKGESYNDEKIGLPLLNGAADYKGKVFKPKYYTSEPTRTAKKGDILLGVRATIGNFTFSDNEYCIGRGVAAIRVDENKADKGYVIKCVEKGLNEIIHTLSGSTIKGIRKEDLTEMKLNLPPLPQQQKIANILDAADALRQNDKALIAKYDELTQALFLDMFGDPVSNPKGWEFKVLNQLVSKLGDGLHGTPKYSEDGEYYFVNGNNLDNGKITISENTKRVDFSEYEKHKKDLNENTMLVSINGTIGKIAFYNNEKIILGKSACYFNLMKGSVNDIFLFHIFKSDYFLRYSSSLSTGSTIQNVSLKTMREFPIPIPPLELQNQFAERVAVIEEQKAIAQKSLEKSESLFNSLLQKAFKGELE